jgi:tripartite-type tricarboxylate transporter receptor subunit TctC
VTATADTHSINPQTRKGLAYDAIRDFEPLALFATLSMMWVARPDLPYRSMAEVLAGALLETATGMNLNHVPFQGAAPAVAALTGTHIDLRPSSRVSAASLRASGKTKVLGLASTRRAAGELSDVPTLEEQGIKGAEAGSWYGLMAPKGIPDDVRQKLVSGIGKVLATPAIRDRIAATGSDPVPLTAAEFQDFLKVQYETLGKVIRSKQITLTD